jgi:uncharacterized alkaline shock family protein YloU
MRSGYAAINNYNNLGTMGISHRVFETIATRAANEVSGAEVKKSAYRLFNLDKPVTASIRKDGGVDIKMDVIIKQGEKVQDVCLKIQEEVKSAITMMCETVPFSVQIKVVSVK